MLIWCEIHSVSNIHRHLGNREWVYPICIHTHLINNWWWKHKLKIRIRNQKIKGTFICGPLWGISILRRLFVNYRTSIYLIYKVFHLSSLCMLVSITMLQFENALTCSLITLFFKCIKLHQILSLISIINSKPCIFAGN